MLVRVQLAGEERRVGVDEFESLVRSHEIGPETPVERDGIWIAAADWPGFQALRESAETALSQRWNQASVPWVTALAVGIAIRIHLAVLLAPDFRSEALGWMLRSTPDIFERGESWRLLSYGLLHGSVPHLLSNMAGVVVAGMAIERLLGSVAMLTILSSTVFAGGLLSAFRLTSIPSLGMSAGDFGLLGACAAMGVRFGTLLPKGAQAAFGSTAALCTLQFFTQGLSAAGVDNWCHFGGLVGGLALGALYRPAIQAWKVHNLRVSLGVGAGMLLVMVALAATSTRWVPFTAYPSDGVVAERPEWWTIQVARSGSRGYGSSDRDNVVALSTSKHGAPPEPSGVLESELRRIQRLDPAGAMVFGPAGSQNEARAQIRYLADGEFRVAQFRVVVRGLYATVGVVDTREGAPFAPRLLAEGLENWRLTDPPALERARLENGTWRAKVESATALAEFGEAEAAKARFAEARQLAPHEMAVDLAELRVLHTMGDPRASAAGVEAVARFPESDRVRAAAVLVGAVVASPEGTTGK